MMNSRRIKLAGHIVRMEKIGMHLGYFWKSRKEDKDVGVRIILRLILERYDEILWTGLIWLRIGTGGRLL
jgi:hypothetical protein